MLASPEDVTPTQFSFACSAIARGRNEADATVGTRATSEAAAAGADAAVAIRAAAEATPYLFRRIRPRGRNTPAPPASTFGRDLVTAMANNAVCRVGGAPGAGKTTRMPIEYLGALMEAELVEMKERINKKVRKKQTLEESLEFAKFLKML